MSSLHALIQNSIVLSLCYAEPGQDVGVNRVIVPVPEGTPDMTGWTYDGSTFSPPVVPAVIVPEIVTNYQARQALINAGLFTAVNSLVMSSSNLSAQQAWEYANTFRRDSPFIALLGSEAGFSSDQIDALFIAADLVV